LLLLVVVVVAVAVAVAAAVVVVRAIGERGNSELPFFYKLHFALNATHKTNTFRGVRRMCSSRGIRFTLSCAGGGRLAG